MTNLIKAGSKIQVMLAVHGAWMAATLLDEWFENHVSDGLSDDNEYLELPTEMVRVARFGIADLRDRLSELESCVNGPVEVIPPGDSPLLP